MFNPTYDQVIGAVLIALAAIVAIASLLLFITGEKNHQRRYGYRKTVIRRKKPW